MENWNALTDYSMEQAVRLLAIDSPSGYTRRAAEYVMDLYRGLGYAPAMTAKGGVLVCLNPDAPAENGLLLEAHLDTLGAMVRSITSDGQLKFTPWAALSCPLWTGNTAKSAPVPGRPSPALS